MNVHLESGAPGDDAAWLASHMALVDAVLTSLLPPSQDRGLPAPGGQPFVAFVASQGGLSTVRHVLQGYLDEAGGGDGTIPPDPGGVDWAGLSAAVQRKLGEPYLRFATLVLEHYYSSPEVMRALGLGQQPPFPGGRHVEAGDLSMLEPVYDRGKIYRSVEVP